MAETLAPAKITVRMYRGILGDCFLLTYRHKGGPFRILIDCGVLQGVSGGADRIRKIAADVAKEVDWNLDLLVLTHEHYDHLSGFALAAKDVFFNPRFSIKELWLAWTEDRTDEQAKALRQRLTKAKTAIALTARLAASPAFAADKSIQLAAELADFIGPVTPGLAANGTLTGAQVIEEFQRKVRPEGIRFLEPGELRQAAPGLRAYVLGPPRKIERLRKDTPTQGVGKEVYLAALDEGAAVESAARAMLASLKAKAEMDREEKGALAVDAGHADPEALPEKTSALAADDAGADADVDARLDSSPFAELHHRSLADGEQAAAGLLQDGAIKDPRVIYFHGPEDAVAFASPATRQIADDWTAAAESLALKLDSDTNNTSLALAFELPDRQILLFPGDAQVGNWLSWGDQTYPAEDDSVAPLTINDLLRRVTLYKVGHHASHNATLREVGLERMTDGRLIAMIPVVEEVAKRQGKADGDGWKMPFKPLYDRLMELTSKRVLRGDGDEAAERAAFVDDPTASENAAALAYDTSTDRLWVEVTITSGAPPVDSGADNRSLIAELLRLLQGAARHGQKGSMAPHP